MPREHRKRGKKKAKAAEPDEPRVVEQESFTIDVEPTEDPAWMRPENPNADIEAPFGYVDGDVKAYFRTVDSRIKEWQQGQDMDEDMPQEADSNEGEHCWLTCLW